MALKKDQKKPLNKYIQFTGIAFQMGGTIYLGSVIGEWLDSKYPTADEVYVKICTLTAVFLAIYSVIKQVIKFTKNES